MADADLPIVESFADVGSCKEDPSDLDLDEPDEPGVQIIDMNCTFTFVRKESGERPPTLFHAREYPSGRPEFYVAVYATAEEAVLAEATGVQVGASADDPPRNVIRVSNVLAVVQPVDDALTEQIRDTLEDLYR